MTDQPVEPTDVDGPDPSEMPLELEHTDYEDVPVDAEPDYDVEETSEETVEVDPSVEPDEAPPADEGERA